MSKKPTLSDSEILSTLNSNHIYKRNQIEWYTKFSRFGYFEIYNTNSITREYIFFTKMDLHLFEPNTQNLSTELQNIPFFVNCYNNYRDVMNQLQWSSRHNSQSGPFCNLLTNAAKSKIDLSDMSIDKLETAANTDGVRLEYPLANVTSSNLQDFTIEFEDTIYLEVYMFFRIWYEYEVLKADGLVTPPTKDYTFNKILHDQMSAYKITVGEDGETIIHWAKLWGVYPTTIPRSAFSDLSDGNPIRFSVTFNAQWVEDMEPTILSDFNTLVIPQLKKFKDPIPLIDSKTGLVNGQWCNVPYIVSAMRNNRQVYKLLWR